MKINFGCGKRVLDGFFNIDAVVNPGAKRNPELIFALDFDADGSVREQIPLEDGCSDYVQAMHVIEHFYFWQASSVLAEFRRLLKPGGKLVMELPDIEKAARNLLKGDTDQMSMWPLYGDWSHKDPYMMHRHGYTPATITDLLLQAGFRNIQTLPPQTHGRRHNRDMRAEAVK